MSTAQTLIDDALYAIGVLGQGDSAPSSADRDLGLRRLQYMLDAWAVDGLLVYARTQETMSLTAGDGTYAASNLSTASRPIGIDGGFVRYGSTDYPLRFVTRAEWNDISDKDTQGIPEVVKYEPSMTGDFSFYPVPVANMTAYFDVRRVLTGTLALSTSLSLPTGMEEAIVDNLAVALSRGGFGIPPSPELIAAAKRGKKLLRTLNYQPVMARVFDVRRYDINGDV